MVFLYYLSAKYCYFSCVPDICKVLSSHHRLDKVLKLHISNLITNSNPGSEHRNYNESQVYFATFFLPLTKILSVSYTPVLPPSHVSLWSHCLLPQHKGNVLFPFCFIPKPIIMQHQYLEMPPMLLLLNTI
jgi:hypothetical protein